MHGTNSHKESCYRHCEEKVNQSTVGACSRSGFRKDFSEKAIFWRDLNYKQGIARQRDKFQAEEIEQEKIPMQERTQSLWGNVKKTRG